jgi:hypothetical protein
MKVYKIWKWKDGVNKCLLIFHLAPINSQTIRVQMFIEMDENKTYLYLKEARRPTMVQKIYTWLLYA